MKHPNFSHRLMEEVTNLEAEHSGRPHDHSTIPKTRPRILVVEDEPSVAGLLSNVLENLGYEVLKARNGREGLDVVASHAIDGILLDMHMPEMDGRTMLDELRWLGYRMPVLVMSGGLDLPALRQLLNEGAQGFFLKPVTLESLKQSCQQLFKKDEPSSSSPQHFHPT